MAALFNAIPFLALSEFLASLGFVARTIVTKEGHEVVFERANEHDPRFIVCVYTSCSPTGQAVRGKGKDAIRVCLVAQSEQVRQAQVAAGWKLADGRVGLSSATRVNRAGTTDAIFSRIRERARDMYRLANQMIKSVPCECGAPTYPDSGKCILRQNCGCTKARVA